MGPQSMNEAGAMLMTAGDKAAPAFSDRVAAILLAGVRGAGAFLLANWRWGFAGVALLASLVFTGYMIVAGKMFYDTPIYWAGLEAYLQTGTPYDWTYLYDHYNLRGPFTYPPVVVVALAPIYGILTHPVSLVVLALVHFAAFLVTPYLLAPKIFRLSNPDWAWMSGLYLFAFGLGNLKQVISGNLQQIIMAACLIALVYSVRKRNWLWFWGALFVVAQIKIYMLVLLAVPFLMERKILAPAIVAALSIAGFFANYWIAPDLMPGFVKTFTLISGENTALGFSVMAGAETALRAMRFHPVELIQPIGFGINVAFAALAMAFATAVMWTKARPKDEGLAYLWALTCAFLVSPRMIESDIAILIIPFVLFLRQLVTSRGIGLWVALGAFTIGTCLTRTPMTDWSGFVALFGVWLAIGLEWLGIGETKATPARA